MFLRAVSIVAVVVGHFGLPDLTGSVRALFVVSGLSFGRYLVPQVLKTERVAPVTRLLVKIAVPTVLYSLLVNLAFGRPFWPGMFLINNLVSPDIQRGGIGFWFIDVLAQCFLLLAALLSVRAVRQAISKDPFRFALGATVLLSAVALVAPYVWETSHLYDRVPHYYLGAMCLGWGVAHADSPRRKLLVVAATVLTFAGPAWLSQYLVVFPFVATFFLIFSPRVPLPLRVGKLVHVIAGASLFIYLLDHQVRWALTKAGLGDHPVVMVTLAVAIGVVAKELWERASSVVLRRRSQLGV